VTDGASADRRLLILAATFKDATTTQMLLSPLGVAVTTCRNFDELLKEVDVGCGATLVAEECMSPGQAASLQRLLGAQAPWSDLPVLILTRPGADSAAIGDAVRMLGNVTLLERPLRVATLVTAVRTALRARERQYQIREHLAERTAAEESLRLADRRKDEFLATLGHELRNPLAPLLTAVQLLRTAGASDPIVARVCPVMERQISHLVRLVSDLLEVSRITRGLIEVRREPVDLVFLVQSALDTSRPLLDEAGHHVTVELPDEPVIVHGDTVRLTQVFANLLNNAAKYTRAGGNIAVRVTRDAYSATVSVCDDGIGIAAENLVSVFEMFTQVDRSNRLAQGGLGIGLTLVRSLVAMHGGTVQARSEGPGTGSEFTVSLPLIAAIPRRSTPIEQPVLVPQRRILIVDDNRDAADTLGALLTALGATVLVVNSGRAALEQLDAFRPDAAILDIGMPEMDGYEVAQRIRSMNRHRSLLLIALTGWGQESDQRRAHAAGFDHHVVKPPDIAKLRELLVR
jgi:two-component system, sensor histidine kinase